MPLGIPPIFSPVTTWRTSCVTSVLIAIPGSIAWEKGAEIMPPRFFPKTMAFGVMVRRVLTPTPVPAPATNAQATLRAALALVAGEDPSINGFPPATGDARLQLPDR